MLRCERDHESDRRPLADGLVSLVLMKLLPVGRVEDPARGGGASGLREDADQARDTATPLTSAM